MKPSKALIAKWYKKAKQSGFEDIEDEKGMLKSWTGTGLPGFSTASNRTGKRHGNYEEGSDLNKGRDPWYGQSLLNKQSTVEYYRLARQYLHEKTFKSPLHKTIWELHAEGWSINRIKDELKLPWHIVRYRIDMMRKAFYNTSE